LPAIDFLIITSTNPAKIYDEHQQAADIEKALAKGVPIHFEMACNLLNYARVLQNFMDYCQRFASEPSLFSMLIHLIQANKIKLTLKFLNKKPDMDYCKYDLNGNTLWHHAVMSGNSEYSDSRRFQRLNQCH